MRTNRGARHAMWRSEYARERRRQNRIAWLTIIGWFVVVALIDAVTR
jgi:hypothetical protein